MRLSLEHSPVALFCSVGRIHPIKGNPLPICAIREIRGSNFFLWVYGSGHKRAGYKPSSMSDWIPAKTIGLSSR